MANFYQLLDYPQMPEELLSLDHLDNESENLRIHGVLEDGVTPKKLLKDKKQVSVIKYVIGPPKKPSAIVSWAIKNIPVTKNKQDWPAHVKRWLRVRYTDGRTNDGIFPAHTDFNCVASLMYFWQLGGDEVVTSWYRHGTHPLVGEFKDNPYDAALTTVKTGINYNELVRLESLCAVTHQWYLYCGAVMHDVQNIVDVRQYISIAFPTFEDLDHFGFKPFDFQN